MRRSKLRRTGNDIAKHIILNYDHNKTSHVFFFFYPIILYFPRIENEKRKNIFLPAWTIGLSALSLIISLTIMRASDIMRVNISNFKYNFMRFTWKSLFRVECLMSGKQGA